MKKILLLLLTTYLFGEPINFKTVEADFIQTVTNDQNKVITYKGKLFLSKDNEARWQYTAPIEKSVISRNNRVSIIEPELYQVTVIKTESELNLVKIYKSSLKAKNKRIAYFDNMEISIYEDKNFITKLAYKDKIDNKIEIVFSNVKKNQKLSKEIFN
ncbi:MAG: LolA-like outer membrane lipoprotein chaperone, partial [Campylobacterales bacterium]|nr:LolA-like outer membrane lipoprotein chaperone [Campylobacterales bacterium]